MSVPASPGPQVPYFPPPAPPPRRRKWPWVAGALVVVPAPAAGSREGHSGRALLGWTRFGSPGIFG